MDSDHPEALGTPEDKEEQPPTKAASQHDEQPPTEIADPAAQCETQSINAWSLEDGSTEVTPYRQRSWKVPIALAVTAVVAAIGVGLWISGTRNVHNDLNAHPPSSPNTPTPTVPTALPMPSPAAVPAAPPQAATPPANAKFYGEWGNHFLNITLAPDGTARYAVSDGAMNTSSWSATWSPVDANRAMVVLTKQLELHEESSDADLVLSRYPGQAFTFTVETDGYATITLPDGKPRDLCPRETGFHDTEGRCGA
jgi:hypothetical protein